MEPGKKIFSILISGFFILFLFLQIINDEFHFSKEKTISKSENRTLAAKPDFIIEKLDPFPKRYEKYYNDHFLFREEMNYYLNYFNYLFFNRSAMPEFCTVGKNGWLFLTLNEKPLYTGKVDFTKVQIDSIIKGLIDRNKWLSDQGIKLYVAIPPVKAEIYPEYLPDDYLHVEGLTSTEKITEAIKKHPEINFIDLVPPLIEGKKNERIYNLYDNHWNSKGAFIAYREIISKIRKDFPSTGYPERDDIIFKDTVHDGGNLATALNLQELLREKDFIPCIKNERGHPAKLAGYKAPPNWEWIFERVWQVDDGKLPKAVVIRDSYTNAMIPFLKENFSKSVYIFDEWQYRFHPEIIKNEKPDLVILIIFEPHLRNLLKPNINN